jgi:hypothetical protein
MQNSVPLWEGRLSFLKSDPTVNMRLALRCALKSSRSANATVGSSFIMGLDTKFTSLQNS